MANITPKEGGGDPAQDQPGWNPGYGFQAPPAPPPPVTPVTPGGSLGSGNWRVPTVAPNFQYPAALLAQIGQSFAPQPYGGQFGRFSFSQGTSAPPNAPGNWGIQNPGTSFAPPSPVNWAQSPWFNRPVTPPPLSWGMNPWAFSGAINGGGLLGGGPPNSMTKSASTGPTSVGPATYGGNSGGSYGSNSGGSLPSYYPNANTAPVSGGGSSGGSGGTYRAPGLLSWGNPPPPSGPGMTTGGAAPASGWSPNPSFSPAQNMASYNAYINQSPQSFLAGLQQQPDMQSMIQYLMQAPPSISSQLMNNSTVQNMLGGQNWRQNFTSGYYNAPAR